MTRVRGKIGVHRQKLAAWTRTRLWAQVLVGLAAGVCVGAVLGPDVGLVEPATGETIGRWLAIPGRVFLGLISLVLVPLVLVSIVQGITGSGGGERLRRLGGRLLAFVVVTTTLASVLGVLLATTLKPGDLLMRAMAEDQARAAELEQRTAEIQPADAALVPAPQPPDVGQTMLDRGPDLVVDLVPTNVTAIVLERNMLAIVIVAVLLGIACTVSSRDRVRPLLDVFAAVLEIAMSIVKWAMFLAPLAVFGLIAQLVIQVGLGSMGTLAAYAGTVLLGLLVLYAMFLGIVAVFTRHSVIGFARAIAPVQLVAFSTSSTAAVMPMSISTAVGALGVRSQTANLVIPLAATINMAGTALYQTVAVLFLAQAAGLDLSVGVTVGVVVSVVAASIGAPGTPGVGVVILSQIATGAGIPATGLPLVLGLDRPLDMVRTAVNVTGDLTACVVVDGGRGGSGEG
ncbi:MAG: dicarboxylate/amino acid:cation symporter [Phycisphaerales bacterium]